eukprot:CAMPEP_0113935546 /NCGR_PEP_ID=MMETSP1339-20121228/2688_1 /TAXON_ID=94617 /ORGANISM="Fibrocapsa japonica" /LENGTH=224 /DNA_ID=CAMNT_0000937747 /DNA_START=58 /DNA_END=732 /DNA_ORIENTATION=+ /assembly_acc=CAM_ASM_000762
MVSTKLAPFSLLLFALFFDMAQSVTLEEHVDVLDGTRIFSRQMASGCGTTKGIVVLLHGARYSSQDWVDLNTPETLASQCYQVIAPDLPGYGQSGQLNNLTQDTWLKAYLDLLGVSGVVVVSPSMSGGFSLPLLMSHPEYLKGYMPIAPVSTGTYTEAQYHSVNVPTLIFYGENDTGIGQPGAAYLRNIPTSHEVVVPNAPHACYLANPQMFYDNLLGLLNDVY